MSFHLLIEDQGLVLPASVGPFDPNQFMLCPWATSFFQKLRPAPFPPVTLPPSEILLPYSYGKQKGEGPSSVIASRLNRGIDPAYQGVKISGNLI